MRRKSDRNKSKSSPEKRERTTRKSSRRRGKATPSPSESPNKDLEQLPNTQLSEESNETQLQPNQDYDDSQDIEKAHISSSGLIKSVLTGASPKEEDNGSVWKVARQDASPGEIQKLKLCRQRNISESNKSNKWSDSGEGGVEGADSAAEEQSSCLQPDSRKPEDAPSPHPSQEYSTQEVSDYKESLTESTSANLSDDKKNIDQSHLATTSEESPENNSEITSTNLPTPTDIYKEPSHESDEIAPNILVQDQEDRTECSPEGDHHAEMPDLSIQDSNEHLYSQDNVDSTQQKLPEEVTRIEGSNETGEQYSQEESQEEYPNKEESQDENKEQEEFRNEEEKCGNKGQEYPKNEESSPEIESKDYTHVHSSVEENGMESPPRKEANLLRRKPHNKYEDRSESESAESDQENSHDGKKIKNGEKDTEVVKEDQFASESYDLFDTSVINKSTVELETNDTMERDDVLEINEKLDDINASLSVSSVVKPAKVSLKRSFSARISTDSETKKEDAGKNNEESNQNKENHNCNEQISVTRKRRWGMTSSSSDTTPAVAISTDSLKAIVPGAKPIPASEVKLSKDDDDVKERKRLRNDKDSDSKSKEKDGKTSRHDSSKKDEKLDNHVAKRKITVIKETKRQLKSLSPPCVQPTNVLLIKNLVRPFTVTQIKELLSRTGKIQENGFWMDRIKSKCYVQYANQDQAFETRQALHGVSWPASNPKKLIVEYASKEDMDTAKDLSKEQPVRKVEPILETASWQQEYTREERNNTTKQVIIREWDLGKEDGQVSSKEKERERKEYEKRRRQRSPIVEVHLPAPARKFKKKEEEPPTAKLLDDLFKKTKATPCIYWLPLTNEQIMVKEEMRRKHMAEHARRLEEMRRADRSRDSRRRRSPRK